MALFMTRLALAALFLGLHDRRLAHDGLVAADDEVADDRIVVTERRGEFVHGGIGSLDVHEDVVGFVNLGDGIGQLSATPIFQTMHTAAVFSDELAVAFNHARNLLRLVGMHHEHDFVVSHRRTPYGLQPPESAQCGKEKRPEIGRVNFRGADSTHDAVAGQGAPVSA